MRTLLRLALLAAALSAPPLMAASPLVAAQVSALPFSAQEAQSLINRYRRAHDLPPLVLDRALMQAAARHARDMAGNDRLAHSVSRGNLYARMGATGRRPRLAAENVSGGYRSVDAVIRGWQNSPGHNRNLLLPGARRMGIAAVKAPGTRYTSYWALIVASGE